MFLSLEFHRLLQHLVTQVRAKKPDDSLTFEKTLHSKENLDEPSDDEEEHYDLDCVQMPPAD